MSWHAIFVQTGKEDTVCSRMTRLLEQVNYKAEYELLVPKRKLQERHQGQYVEVVTKMFPGYVLVKSNEIKELYSRTLRCRYIIRFLKDDKGFEEIKLEEIANIINMIDSDGVIGVSDVFVENDIVKVTSGSMIEYSGWVKKIDKHKKRAKVLFKFGGLNHLIDLPINIIRKPSDDEIKNELMFFTSRL